MKFETTDEILIYHYNNYIWFKENGLQLIEDIKNIKDTFYFGMEYTFKQLEGKKAKTYIFDDIDKRNYLVMDNMNQFDVRKLFICEFSYDSQVLATSDRNVIQDIVYDLNIYSPTQVYKKHKRQIKGNILRYVKEGDFGFSFSKCNKKYIIKSID